MLHNKYFHILRHFLGDYQKELHGRGLTGKVPLSQKGIALALEELEEMAILKHRKVGNTKHYGLNPGYSEIRDVLSMVEFMRKIEFFSHHRKLAHLFMRDDRVVGLFGSYARGDQKKHSDIDLFVVGEKRNEEYDSAGKAYDLNVSIRYFPEKEFKKLLENKNELCREIIKYHVLVFGVEKFVYSVWRHFYGFD